MNSATAFAPATVANVAVGFDVLGFSFSELGDLVTVTRDDNPEAPVVIEAITPSALDPDVELPLDAERNTAGRALLSMREALGISYGYRVRIAKGIPLGSGMGGSAASAVGAVVAANALCNAALPNRQLLQFALDGEAVASGVAHGDNAAPGLYGGLCVFLAKEGDVLPLPIPSNIYCVLVRPRLRQDTAAQRAMLRDTVPLELSVEQSACLAAFVHACHRDDLSILARSMQDLIIGPQRIGLIPGGAEACQAARVAGALAASIAGSGPSLFAWVEGEEACVTVRDAMLGTLKGFDQPADGWIAPLSHDGARLVESSTVGPD